MVSEHAMAFFLLLLSILFFFFIRMCWITASITFQHNLARHFVSRPLDNIVIICRVVNNPGLVSLCTCARASTASSPVGMKNSFKMVAAPISSDTWSVNYAICLNNFWIESHSTKHNVKKKSFFYFCKGAKMFRECGIWNPIWSITAWSRPNCLSSERTSSSSFVVVIVVPCATLQELLGKKEKRGKTSATSRGWSFQYRPIRFYEKTFSSMMVQVLAKT